MNRSIVPAIRPRGAQSRAAEDASWYRDAIIYQTHVRAFFDSDGDGVGDFPGLLARLDYLAELGVTALWLLPFFPSPLKDDGYDVAEYCDVNPAYGTLADFEAVVEAAHARGIRVIIELVVNHTSDQHPWFQRARRAPKGSPERDFYVWSETGHEYEEARIIFIDSEVSNWTWDPVARAYYWHRFYGHQPDLNYDNPLVLAEVKRVLHFWLDRGVDGFRLDAVPYLVERDGTSGENLPETHGLLRAIRAEVEKRRPDCILLAEANQLAGEAVHYFGRGDECHMAFHFPLMPRMFMALAMADSEPIIDIVEKTMRLPDGCQWAIFLRNHDELTLEMVTEEERDYMWQYYATHRHLRINLGIRRRLAPLVDGDRRRIEVLNGLLFSMPGTPVIYYGDEIGMGDNPFLGDRDGVRTPMQWSPDRNAGFSSAEPVALYLPPVLDPSYGYLALNVETQRTIRSSLLNWMRWLIHVRKGQKALSRGNFRFLASGNRKVLAYLRCHAEDNVLCVVNLGETAEAAALDLSRFAGRRPVDLFGGSAFPVIEARAYVLTLSGHGFYWLKLAPPEAAAAEAAARKAEGAPALPEETRELPTPAEG